MDVSIIITTRNRKKDLLSCIGSVMNSHFGNLDWELLVVDDFSSDGTEKLQPEDLGLAPATVIHNPSWLMMVKSRNAGLASAKGNYLLFIDDDNVIDANMILELHGFMERNPRFGIAGPSMFYFDSGEKYMDAQRINFFTGKTSSFIDHSAKGYVLSDGIPNVFMVRREVFEKIGKFDEELIQTFTEPDFAFAAKKKGFGCAVCKKAATYHKISRAAKFHPASLGGDFCQKAYCLMRNRTIIVFRYGKIYHKLCYFLFFSWVWPAVYSIIISRHLAFFQMKLYWRGWLDGMKFVFFGKIINSLPKLIKNECAGSSAK